MSTADKIGRDDAERDYHEKLMPAAQVGIPSFKLEVGTSCQLALQSRPDLFPSEKLLQHCSLERYHVMGSRILSRSFTVLKWAGSAEDEDAMVADPDTSASTGSGMDIEMDEVDGTEIDLDEDDMEDPSDVAMVPMADMLNARFESENVRAPPIHLHSSCHINIRFT